MPQTVLPNNQAWAPFLGSSMTYVAGLDPLGLQTPSQRLYTRLVPGLNNVTGRVRYYSFYCWFFQEYARRNGSTDPEVQKEWIRLAEYLLAHVALAQDPEVVGMPGVSYASDIREKNPNTISLKDGIVGADGTLRGGYWQGSWGVFGQYYVGSLKEMELLAERDQEHAIYVRTEDSEFQVSGKNLADAFAKNLDKHPGIQDLFFELLQRGETTKEELEQLWPALDMFRVPAESKEESFLRTLFTGPDHQRQREGPHFRNDTIQFLISWASSTEGSIHSNGFVRHMFKESLSNISDPSWPDSRILWTVFQIHDTWQVCFTAMLDGMLDLLRNLPPTPLEQFLDEVSQQVHTAAVDQFGKLDISLEDVETSLSTNKVMEYWDSYQRGRGAESILHALKTILLLRKECSEYLSGLMQRMREVMPDLFPPRTDSLQYLIDLEHRLEEHVSGFIRETIYKRVIHRQQWVALSKLSRSKSTQKFIIEDGLIRYVAHFGPAFSSPRINNLINFLRDLNYLDSNGRPTAAGRNLLVDEKNMP